MTEEELKQIIKRNNEVLEELDQRIHRIERKFIWNTIFGFIKVVVILSPIIIGVIYLTPIVKDYIKIFNPMIESIKTQLLHVPSSETGIGVTQDSIQDSDAMIETFCDPEAREMMVKQLCQ